MRGRGWVAVLLAAGCLGIPAQQPAATLQFLLDRTGPPRTQYTLTLNSTGEGTYVPHLPGAGAEGARTGEVAEGKPIRVSPAMVKKLFAAVPMVEGGRCETHNKSIAQTGVKVLRYQGAGRTAECTFNYSDDDRVNNAVTNFEAISETLGYGDRLRAKLRFDRLGLDAELDQLLGAVGDGRALEVGNIGPVLQAIQDDERVMDRARRKATRLLTTAMPGQTAAGAGSSDR